uniref:BTB domain-containing protein n=1 Tax=Schistocephalus solidus TaxID=70667 RepID=A0A0X3P7T0_SCHSO
MKSPLPDTVEFKDAIPLVTVCPELEALRVANTNPDIVITVKDEGTVNAHRHILSARVPHLKESLCGPTTEENTRLSWPTHTQEIVETVISYLYTGQIVITVANVKQVYALAKCLRLDRLEEWCQGFIIDRLHISNIADIWCLASATNAQIFKVPCMDLIKLHFEEFVNLPVFAQMDYDTLLVLIESDDLCVSNEEKVVEAITKWIEAGKCSEGQANERASRLIDFMAKIRWGYTSKEFRLAAMSNHQLISSSVQCLQKLGQIEHWLTRIQFGDSSNCPFNQNPRIYLEMDFLVFGKGRYNAMDEGIVEAYCLQNQESLAVGQILKRKACAVVGLQGMLCAIGGKVRGEVTSSVEIFDPKTRRNWPITEMQTARYGHGAVAIGGDIIVCGGKTGDRWLNTCEAFSQTAKSWISLPNFVDERSGLGVTSLSGRRVFVIGGRNGEKRFSSVEYCQLPDQLAGDITDEKFWSAAAPMSHARSGHGVTVFRGQIIVAGGYLEENAATSTVEIFSPPSADSPAGQWTFLIPMSRPLVYFSLLASGDSIYTFGVQPKSHLSAYRQKT